MARMRTLCSRAFLTVLLASLTSLFVTSYYLLQISNTSQSLRFLTQQPSRPQRTDAVILFTQMRSGSSVVAEIFNQRSDVTYFYEPLQPYYGTACDFQLADRLSLLEKIVDCRFDLAEHYKRVFNYTKLDFGYTEFMDSKPCFTEGSKLRNFMFRDADFCATTKSGCNYCPRPLTVEGMSKHCRQSLIRSMKVIYMCKLEWLIPLLSNRTVNLKIVHLVRDPRATVNSRIRPNKSPNRIGLTRGQAGGICARLSENVRFADTVLRKGPLKHQYMRIRHEDFAMRPLETAQAVYDFIGINMNPHVKRWLIKATSTDNDKGLSEKEAQSTKRNPATVVSGWRKSLSWNEVREIQKLCSDALDLLGYRTFENEVDLRDVDKKQSFAF